MLAQMNQLETIVNRILSNANKQTVDRLQPQMNLQKDLKLDSLELAELSIRIEAEFGVDVFEKGLVATVGEVVERIKIGGWNREAGD